MYLHRLLKKFRYQEPPIYGREYYKFNSQELEETIQKIENLKVDFEIPEKEKEKLSISTITIDRDIKKKLEKHFLIIEREGKKVNETWNEFLERVNTLFGREI
jgi:hypothetical protein